MDVLHNTEHVEQGLSLLTLQYQKPNIQALLSVFLRHIQKAEDMLYNVWYYLLFPNAVGDQLDRYGALLKEDRAGREDDEYRVALKVRMRVLRSKGKPLDIIEVSLIALGEPGLTYNEPVAPGRTGPHAFFSVAKENLSAFSVPAIKRALKLAKSAATRGEFVYSISPSEELFRFGSVHDTSIGRGMGSVHDPSFDSKMTSAEEI